MNRDQRSIGIEDRIENFASSGTKIRITPTEIFADGEKIFVGGQVVNRFEAYPLKPLKLRYPVTLFVDWRASYLHAMNTVAALVEDEVERRKEIVVVEVRSERLNEVGKLHSPKLGAAPREDPNLTILIGEKGIYIGYGGWIIRGAPPCQRTFCYEVSDPSFVMLADRARLDQFSVGDAKQLAHLIDSAPWGKIETFVRRSTLLHAEGPVHVALDPGMPFGMFAEALKVLSAADRQVAASIIK